MPYLIDLCSTDFLLDFVQLTGQGNNLVLKNERDGRDVGVGSRGGTTWAYEVGGQAMVCPIVVEDLGPPGQMLIEVMDQEVTEYAPIFLPNLII